MEMLKTEHTQTTVPPNSFCLPFLLTNFLVNHPTPHPAQDPGIHSCLHCPMGSLNGSVFGCYWISHNPFINSTDNINTYTHASTHIYGWGWAISTSFIGYLLSDTSTLVENPIHNFKIQFRKVSMGIPDSESVCISSGVSSCSVSEPLSNQHFFFLLFTSNWKYRCNNSTADGLITV